MLYRWLVKLPVMLDIARGSILEAWLRACCLFIITSKSMGVSCSNLLGLKDFLKLLLLSTARVKLVLLVKNEENILSTYYCLCSVSAADYKVTTAEKITTAEKG
ncbi:hypothetical protein Tco_1497022 [Tanacetum coccineum]